MKDSRHIQGGKMAQGKAEHQKHLEGQRLTRKQAMKAFCYECQGGYSGGVKDCETFVCPLYQYHPYRKKT